MRPIARSLGRLAAASVVAVAAAPLHAQVSWTDWTGTAGGTVTGTLMFGSTPVGVTYSGPFAFVIQSCGTDYYAVNPSVYTGAGVPNRPTGCDLIGLNTQATHTITFSQAVTDPLLAFLSVNGQRSLTFSGPVQVVNAGCGYWGCGTASVSAGTPNVVDLNGGEGHGTIRVLGSYTSFTFTTTRNEYWHGITVGAVALPTAVPEPSTYVLMGTGLIGIFGAARRRRRST
jgi:hypothetical protein